MVIFEREVQFKKQLYGIDCRLFPSTALNILVHLSNTLFPILVTLLGNEILSKLVQHEKADVSIKDTLCGIITLVIPSQFENAAAPTLFNSSFKTTFVTYLQYAKAKLPILVTSSETIIDLILL